MEKIILLSALLFAFLSISSSVFAQAISSVTNPLSLENVSTSLSRVYVGSNFTMTGTIRNVADRGLTNIEVTVQGGFPFSKTSPLTSFYVGSLAPNQTYVFSVPLSIDNDATNQQYSLQFVANYAVYDPAVTKIANVVSSETMSASVKVDKGADLEIVNATFPQPMTPDAKGAVIVVYIQNMGINSADQVEFNLAAQYPFTPSGKTFFVDQINPGETVAATFHVDVDSSAAAQNFPLDMTINWKEGNNQYSSTKTFGIPVIATNISYSVSNFAQSNLIAIAAIIILAVGGFYFWKRRGRKSKGSAKT